MPSTLKVRNALLDSFLKLVDCAIPTTKENIKKFENVLEEIEENHAQVDLVQSIAVGVLELKERVSLHRKALVELKSTSPNWNTIRLTEKDILPYEELAAIQEPLDHINRLIIRYNFLSRMLLNMGSDLKKVGMVDLEINLENVVRGAVDEARQICTDHYGDCPDVDINFSTDSKTFRFAFMSTTIRYIVVELLKNAFRATVEAHMTRNEAGIVTCDDMPPVNVLVHLKEGVKHACIRISDEGNGMPQANLEKAMSYTFTSVSKPAMSLDDGDLLINDSPSPLAGYGYGLPMSRVYAMSFGGDLALQTMEGFGTRAYYYIRLE
ncbi:pyruvate dehydrogenase kinase [Angomonas deanei]|nr:pyruvate dehydrogenase kinase [Angomonas deanei]|eukprot:EPY25280.1 pyruvate dehydrogenase kinase [Angomonas deanei]